LRRHLLDFNLSRIESTRGPYEFRLMSRMPKESQEEPSGARFREVLAEVARARAARHDEPAEEEVELSSFASHPLAGAIYTFGASPRMGAGGGSHWDSAIAWLDEQDEPGPAPEPAPVEVTPELVLKELGPTEHLSLDELNRLRRLYMWRNHPDRRGEAQRESATRRVAIANMLLDRAQARLASAQKA
jgi:hypothetical protein